MTSKTSAQGVRRVAVIGAGTMGHGIAQVTALAGYSVALADVDEAALSAARERVRANLEKGVEKGKVAAADVEPTLARIEALGDFGRAAANADVVIEAVPETPDLKADVFRRLGESAPSGALLATNTSSISVGRLAAEVSAPERVVGMHFFNPVHIMKLVEVIAHEGSADGAVALARDLAEAMGKTPITARDAPGFASSRLGVVIGLEAMRMVEQGVATAEGVDTAMRLGYGYPMGPLELSDMIGLDTRLGIAEYLESELGEVFRVPRILRDKVAAGKLGKKAGIGFYRWEEGSRSGPDPDDSPR